MQEGAVTLGRDGTILYCNRRLGAMLGVPQQRIVGQQLHPFVLDADQARFNRLLDDAANDNAEPARKAVGW